MAYSFARAYSHTAEYHYKENGTKGRSFVDAFLTRNTNPITKVIHGETCAMGAKCSSYIGERCYGCGIRTSCVINTPTFCYCASWKLRRRTFLLLGPFWWQSFNNFFGLSFWKILRQIFKRNN